MEFINTLNYSNSWWLARYAKLSELLLCSVLEKWKNKFIWRSRVHSSVYFWECSSTVYGVDYMCDSKVRHILLNSWEDSGVKKGHGINLFNLIRYLMYNFLSDVDQIIISTKFYQDELNIKFNQFPHISSWDTVSTKFWSNTYRQTDRQTYIF